MPSEFSRQLFLQGWHRFRAQGLLQFFAVMGFVYLVTFNFTPMFGLQIAFRDYKPAMGLSGFFNALVTSDNGFYHFLAFFRTGFFHVMRNTVCLSLLNIVFLPASHPVRNRHQRNARTRMKRVVQTVSYLPHFISWVIVYALPRSCSNTANGVVNEILKVGTPRSSF